MSVKRRYRKMVERRRTDGTERGFTLIELLIVITITPLVVGAVTVAILAVLRLQTGTASSLTASGDAQVTSASYVGDVQSATWVTTNPAVHCGPTGSPALGTPVLTLSSNNVPQSTQITSVVSYVEVQQGAVFNLFRRVCQASNFTTPTGSHVVAHNVPTGLQASIQPAVEATAAKTSWVASTSISSVQLVLAEPTSNFSYNLAAVPRAWTATNNGVPVPPFSPLLPFEVLGGGACPIPPNAPALTIGGTSTFTIGTGGNGFIGVASTCDGSISMPRSGTLSGNIVTADPNGKSVSGGGGAVFPQTETYQSTGISNPFASLVAPPNPSTSGLGAGSCGNSICTAGLYSSAVNISSGANISFAPTTSPNPNPVFVFNQPVDIARNAVVQFLGGSNVSNVTYWFRGGLTIEGAATVNFGLATYIFGDAASPPANALSILNGSTIGGSGGLLFYIEAGPGTFAGATNTPVIGTSQYDEIAIWDASTSTLALNGGSSVSAPLGGIYDPNGTVSFSGNTGLVTSFVVANSVTAPGGSATVQIGS
jgi:prepilin-type N-terminal cleavage/methylation domain-containing protein